jgi:hypothetical protein
MTGYVKPKKGNVNIRPLSDTTREPIGLLTSGSSAKLIKAGEKWHTISWMGKEAFISAAHVDVVVDAIVEKPTSQPKVRFMSQAEVVQKYGKADPNGGYLVSMTFPFEMKIAWSQSQKVRKTRCHRLVKEQLESIFSGILSAYGEKDIDRLGINLFGGIFNYRDIRNRTGVLSRHSWGIAIDLDPARNQLQWGKDRAVFAKEEYKPMIDMFYKHGFLSLGRERNKDFMHFEVGLAV